MAHYLARSDLVGDVEILFLLRLHYGGRVFFFSSQPCDPIDTNGTHTATAGAAIAHSGGLDSVHVDRIFEPNTDTPTLPSVDIDLTFPGDTDVALMEARGLSLESAIGELSIWKVGATYENRQILISGRISNPSYGRANEPISFALEQRPFDDRTLIPSHDMRVTLATWPLLATKTDPKDLNKYYPIVFGRPGIATRVDGVEIKHEGSPALLVGFDDDNADTLIVAGHQVKATTCTIFDSSGNSAARNISTTADGLGRLVSTVDLTGSGLTLTDTEFWCAWDGGDAMISMTGDTVEGVNRGGDLIRWLLSITTLLVDPGRLAAAVPTLNQFRFSGYIDDPISPYEYIVSELLPFLPATFYAGPSGIYPIITQYNSNATTCVMTLEDGRNCERVTRIQPDRDSSQLINVVRLDYAMNGKDQNFKLHFVLGPTAEIMAQNGLHVPDPMSISTTQRGERGGSYLANVSFTRLRELREESHNLATVTEAQTANLIAGVLMRRAWTVGKVLDIAGGLELGALTPGDLVAYTDADLYLTDQVALVRMVDFAVPSVRVSLLVLEDPARDARPTS